MQGSVATQYPLGSSKMQQSGHQNCNNMTLAHTSVSAEWGLFQLLFQSVHLRVSALGFA